MKIGFLSESRVDQEALAIFAEGLIGERPEQINIDLEARGVGQVMSILAGIFKGVYYNSDAEAFVVVVDSDDSELHDPSHDADGADVGKCRYCKCRRIISEARKHLGPRPNGLPPLRVAIGLAVPSIEAWYLVGVEHQVGEIAYRTARHSVFTRPALKLKAYGSRPSAEKQLADVTTHARRVVEKHMKEIESAFPVGFGLLANDIRSWIAK